MSRRWVRVGLLAEAFGVFVAGGCLVPNAEHCAFEYGDGSCEGKMCVLATRKTSHEGVVNGCSEDVPEKFVHVKYGLPITMDVAEGSPLDPGALKGVLVARGLAYECDPEEDFGALLDRVRDVRLHLLEGGRSRRAAFDLDGEQIDAIGEFRRAVDGWVARCEEVGAGGGGGSSGDDPSGASSGGMSESGGSSESTAGPVPCGGGCSGAKPYCLEDRCVSCGDAPPEEGDAACAVVDAMKPLCHDAKCVACIEQGTTVCDDELLVCNTEVNECEACSEHEQCTAGACDVFEGLCFPTDNVVHVGAWSGEGGNFVSIEEGLMMAATQNPDAAVLVLHGGLLTFDEVAMVDTGAVAFVAWPGVSPIWTNTFVSDQATLTVTGPDTRVYAAGLRLEGNTDEKGLSLNGARVDVRRSKVVMNAGGGISAESGAELMLRNSFVGGDVVGAKALRVNASTATILYSTLGAGDNGVEDAARALFCNLTSVVMVRNSLFVARTIVNEEVECDSANFEYNASEQTLPGDSNVALSNMQDSWFEDYSTGDFHLRLHNPMPVPHEVSTAASWASGNPTTDIDGDPRPNGPDNQDYAGADVLLP